MIHAAAGEDRAAMVEALGSGMIAASADKAEGVAAFRAKRKPEFSGNLTMTTHDLTLIADRPFRLPAEPFTPAT
jgi:hypothetical protein